MSEIIKTLEHVISSKTKVINGLITRNGGRGLIKYLLLYTRAVRPKASKSVVRQVASFSFSVHKMGRHSGFKGVVIYLKACQVLLQQCVGGYRVVNLDELKVRPRRNRAGVPLIIPAGVRVLISRDRDIPTIKLGMTLFGLFRILEFKGKLKLSTITNPTSMNPKFLVSWDKGLEKDFKSLLLDRMRLAPLQPPKAFPIMKSGPTTESMPYVSTSGYALVAAARRGMKAPELLKSLTVIAEALKAPSIPNRLSIIQNAEVKDLDGFPGYLGKLGFKSEPAGKVRVFAMVDAGTQGLLAPLHSGIFNILRGLKMFDGTFDQMNPVLRLQRKFGKKPKGRTFSSIDLSAATDRLPISLQVSIIRVLLKDIVPDSTLFAEAWKNLLVGRPYKLSVSPQVKANLENPNERLPKEVLYATGQPMGALSSGAMLALTHHAIVQYAAKKAGMTGGFEDYAILGDDIVIAHGQVAYQYRIILQEIGVEAGLAKSIIARSVFVIEFAKKFFVDTTTANMLPIKECIAVHCSTSMVVEFVRKYKLSLNAILAFLGYGYKARMRASNSSLFTLSTRLRVILVGLTHPQSPFASRSYTSGLFSRSIRDSFEGVPFEIKNQIARNIEVLLANKKRLVAKYIETYKASIHEQVLNLNKTYPVNITSVGGSVSEGDMVSKPPVNIDGTNLIHSDFSGDKEVTVDEYGRVNRNFKDIKQELGWDDSQRLSVEKAMNAAGRTMFIQSTGRFSLTGGVNAGRTGRVQIPSPDERLEKGLKELFAPDPILTIIPETFGAEGRKDLVPFRDFLEVYKLGQELSKPLWAGHYKKEFNPELISRNVPKVKPTKPAIGEQEEGTTGQVKRRSGVFRIIRFFILSILTVLIVMILLGGILCVIITNEINIETLYLIYQGIVNVLSLFT